MMRKLGDAAEKEAKRLRMRRFTYYRNRHARLDDHRLRLAAKLSGAPLYLVEAFVQRLDAFASGATPRGTIDGFSITSTALLWTVNEELLARVWVALEDPAVGWIDDGFVVDFWAENPDTEDPTSNERQDRSRKFRAALQQIGQLARSGALDAGERTRRELAVHALRDRARAHAVTWAEWRTRLAALSSPAALSQRDSVTVTARSDQHLFDGVTPVDNCGAAASGKAAGPSEAGIAEGLSEQQQAELWLASEGARIVTEQLLENRNLAERKIAFWRDQELGGDAAALMAVIKGAAKYGMFGATFLNHVVVGVRQAKRDGAAQRELPMPPVPVGECKLG